MSIYFPKLSSMEQFIDYFKEYLDTTYNIYISREFIQTVLKTNMIIDNDLNHVEFKDSDSQFIYINTLFKNIFGDSLTILVNSFLKYKNDSTKIPQYQSFLLDKIKNLEKELENSKEIIDELRDAYIRVKRENDRLISKIIR